MIVKVVRSLAAMHASALLFCFSSWLMLMPLLQMFVWQMPRINDDPSIAYLISATEASMLIPN